MVGSNSSEVVKIIQDYLEYRQKSLYYHKKKTDAEKEYNKLLVTFGGEIKKFTLEQADKIYKAYCEMLTNEVQSKTAEEKFSEADEKLKELGRILFHATITADISMPPVNGEAWNTKQVTVTFPNGEALVI